jgi:hypothetical protein
MVNVGSGLGTDGCWALATAGTSIAAREMISFTAPLLV